MAKKTKKGKKLDPAKEAASLVRKALKANKQATKAARKEARLNGDDGGSSSEEPVDEADIDALLASFSRLDASSQTCTSAPCPPPAPRANCSLTSAAEQGGARDTLLLFGGEYFDGASNVCNSDLHAYHVPSRSFKIVRSSPCPPPRCSHQAVAFNGGLYVFGGELATAEQYHHYADFWRLDLKSYRWEQVETVKGSQGPQARSGHRMCLWRGHLVLFGGFFESKTTTRWYGKRKRGARAPSEGGGPERRAAAGSGRPARGLPPDRPRGRSARSRGAQRRLRGVPRAGTPLARRAS
jgi:hypothetical protein